MGMATRTVKRSRCLLWRFGRLCVTYGGSTNEERGVRADGRKDGWTGGKLLDRLTDRRKDGWTGGKLLDRLTGLWKFGWTGGKPLDRPSDRPTARALRKLFIRPEIRRDYPLNLSILISGGKETNQDSPSNGE